MSMSGSPIRSSDPIAECREGLRRHVGFDDRPLFDAIMGAALGESEGPSYGVLAGTLAYPVGAEDQLKGITLFAHAVTASLDYYYHLQPDQRLYHPTIFRFDKTCQVKRELWSLIAEIQNAGTIGDGHVQMFGRIQDDILSMKGIHDESDLRDILQLLRDNLKRGTSEHKRHIRTRIDELLAARLDSPRIEHLSREALNLIFSENLLLLKVQDDLRPFFFEDDEVDAVFQGAVLTSVLPAGQGAANLEDIPWMILRNDVQADIVEHSAQLLAGGVGDAVAFVWRRLRREWAHQLAFVRRSYAQRGILADLPTLNAAKVPSWANQDLYAIDGEHIDVILSAERFLGRAKGEARHLMDRLFKRFELVSSTVLEGVHLFQVEKTISTNIHLREVFVLAEALCRLDPKGVGEHVRAFFARLVLDERLSIEDASYLLARSEKVLGPSMLSHIRVSLAERGQTLVEQNDWPLDAVDEINRHRHSNLQRLLRRVRHIQAGHVERLAAVGELGSIGYGYGARYMVPLLEQIETSGPPAKLVRAYPQNSAVQQAHRLSSAAHTALTVIRGGMNAVPVGH